MWQDNTCLPSIWCQSGTATQTAVHIPGPVTFTDCVLSLMRRHFGSSSSLGRVTCQTNSFCQSAWSPVWIWYVLLTLWANGSSKFVKNSVSLEEEKISKDETRQHSDSEDVSTQELLGNLLQEDESVSLPLKSTSCSASFLDLYSRSFRWPFDSSPSVSPWTKGSASAERGCAVLAGVESGSLVLVCCSPSVSARTHWSVPTGLRNRAQLDQERRQRTSEPQTLG